MILSKIEPRISGPHSVLFPLYHAAYTYDMKFEADPSGSLIGKAACIQDRT